MCSAPARPRLGQFWSPEFKMDGFKQEQMQRRAPGTCLRRGDLRSMACLANRANPAFLNTKEGRTLCK